MSRLIISCRDVHLKKGHSIKFSTLKLITLTSMHGVYLKCVKLCKVQEEFNWRSLGVPIKTECNKM